MDKIVCANWKAFLTREESIRLIDQYRDYIDPAIHKGIIVFPNFVHIDAVTRRLEGSEIAVGAQDMYIEKEGAYTGEVCAKQLTELGVRYILLGHSERREHFKEGYDLVNKKLKLALEVGLIPVLCVGESAKEKETGITEMVIVNQLELALKDIDLTNHAVSEFLIAYEPIWAIGGKNPVDVQITVHVLELIGKIIQKHFSELLGKVKLLYGGSIKRSDLAQKYLSCEEIQGILIGKSSIEIDSFKEIVECLR